MIPICLITGFLGAGKTTLLKRSVAENRDRKWIYLVNEFSALDVDGAIVSEENPDVVSIPGGSIFCKCLVTEFIGQLTKIHEQHPDAEGVVIEASGMADPRVIADMLKETRLDQHFELASIISIVEPRSFLRLIHTLPNIIHQVEAADLVLLNKCDLFDEAQLADTERAVRGIKADVNLVRCIKGAADFPIFGPRSTHSELHGEYAKCRDPRYSAFALTFSSEVDAQQLEDFILRNEEDVYRVKGYIPTADGPLYFDYSKAGFSHKPATIRESYGLAWICRGETAEQIHQQAMALPGCAIA
ncbi:CobW family GTP-binding protein [Pontiella sulfatireligans]|uniref:Zinc-binding GTPase YeiR n=1 Tax=Pontiella sulfatireligans TaxID=2750658 RepID=A0A6C2UDB9_9BACT|nr:CobW family GTP-binding protein [Pontiella sulfatireligans]VGO18202.1 Zinc-binding GTPase YeiR [Pontiella sulfatireligans]